VQTVDALFRRMRPTAREKHDETESPELSLMKSSVTPGSERDRTRISPCSCAMMR
jgi:hypothetical protein